MVIAPSGEAHLDMESMTIGLLIPYPQRISLMQ
jgi:hypothetical protein